MQHNKLWLYKEIPQSEIERISREAGVSRLTAKVLSSRGMTEAVSIGKFLNPSLDELYDPFLLKDMDKAVERIVKAVDGRESIMLYGDYDVDGITSISILFDFLKSLGADVEYYIPDRIDEGYGLSISALDKIIQMGKNLVITADCGVTAFEEVEYVNRHGIDIVITDHHECKSVLPDAYAVVNPCRTDCAYPFKELAGVGVIYKLVGALCEKLGQDDVSTRYLDLAALGTVADVVPLICENRTIVKHGIHQIGNTSNLGLRTLINLSGLKGKAISSFNMGFVLAPRVNAAGRIGDAGRAVRLFTTRDEAEAVTIAAELNDENRFRQDTEIQILQEALDIIESEVDVEREKVLVVAGNSWHHGVIGIVASRITEKFYRPCILISLENGIGKGSGRSIEGFNLFSALTHCEGLLEKFGGHELAAGLSLKEENIQAFRSMINAYADDILMVEDLVPKIKIDTQIKKYDINMDSIRELEKLAPFGAGNPGPLFVYNKLKVGEIRTVGDNKHLKLKLETDGLLIDAIGFNMGGFIETFDNNDLLDAVFSLEINSWNSQQSIQLNLKDIRYNDEIIERNNYLYSLDKHIESGRLNEYNRYNGQVEIGDIIPDRSDLVAVYQYIKANTGDCLMIKDLFVFAKRVANSYKISMNYLKLKKSIEIFEELKLLEKEPVGDYGMNITLLNTVKGKANLDNSQLYRELQELKCRLKSCSFKA